MGYRTKIDWCDATWNPVTGCLHGCEYCYARKIADRFGSKQMPIFTDFPVLNEPVRCTDTYAYMREAGISTGKVQPYPFDFTPTFHRYKLEEPKKWSKPRVIFVCSMADLFGEWVPDEWIVEVLNACRRAPQHKYLFLTKNPRRYDDLEDKDLITDKDTNFWLGSTTAIVTQDLLHYNRALHTFQSCEPMLAPWPPAGAPNPRHMGNGEMPEWVIFGAETGNRKDKVVPEKEWVDNAVQMCRNIGAKVFMKESLREIMGEDFTQEFPW